jgi:hypothetical protein
MLIPPLILKILKNNSALAMSPNISLEEVLGIENNYKIYFGCTGIDFFH